MSGKFVLQTGPHHPGRTLWVQRPSARSIFDMTSSLEDAQIYSSKQRAIAAAAKFSAAYGLQPVDLSTTTGDAKP